MKEFISKWDLKPHTDVSWQYKWKPMKATLGQRPTAIVGNLKNEPLGSASWGGQVQGWGILAEGSKGLEPAALHALPVL